MAEDPGPIPNESSNLDPSNARRELAEMARLSRQFGTALSTAFVDAALRGRDLGDVLRSLALRLSEITLRAALKPLTDTFSGALAGLLTGGLGRAAGGTAIPAPVTASGTIANPLTTPLGTRRQLIAPAVAPAAAGPSIVFNITTPDADSFRRSETQIAALLARTVSQGHRNL
jgi:hypothetical protein